MLPRKLCDRRRVPAPTRLDPTEWRWSDAITDDALQDMAQTVLVLFESPTRWIHRRVERITFIDHETIRRQISVDFTLPAGIPAVGRFGDDDVYAAPLFLLGKDHPHPLRAGVRRGWRTRPGWRSNAPRIPTALCSQVTLTDGHGRRLPLLTRYQSGRLAAVMLTEAARRALHGALPRELADSIPAIATLRPERRRKALEDVLHGTEPHLTAARSQLQESGFHELAHVLARYSPVVCTFDGPPGRCLVKLEYTEPLDTRGLNKPPGRIRRSIGWKSEYLVVQLHEIGAGSSHHIEVEVPEDLQVNAVTLRGTRYDLARRRDKLTARQYDYSVHQVGTSRSGAVYIANPPFPRRVGDIAVKMRARRTGFLMAAFVASAITTLVLGAMAVVAPAIIEANTSNGTIAALLVLPTLVAAYIARPGEHAITARMLRFARLLLVANAALPFAAVLVLLTTHVGPQPAEVGYGVVDALMDIVSWSDKPDSALQQKWGTLAGLSAILTLLFAISNYAPRPHGKSHYRLRRRASVGTAES